MGRRIVGEGKHSRNNIKALRIQKDLTLEELSKITGISTSQLSRIELGKRAAKLDVVDKLAVGLGVTRGQLTSTSGATETVTVASYVQAGVWEDALEWPQDDRYEVVVRESGAYGSATRYASEVRGSSMNKVYPEQTVIVWVAFSEINEPMIPGRRYVVHRHDRAGRIEQTCKTFSRDRDGREYLFPESYDDEHQVPIPFVNTKEHKLEIAGRVITSIRSE